MENDNIYKCYKCIKTFVLDTKTRPKCPYCGYRIIIKERTKKATEYLAR